jgi:hypothetical protein
VLPEVLKVRNQQGYSEAQPSLPQDQSVRFLSEEEIKKRVKDRREKMELCPKSAVRLPSAGRFRQAVGLVDSACGIRSELSLQNGGVLQLGGESYWLQGQQGPRVLMSLL